MNIPLLKQVQEDIKVSLTYNQRIFVHDCGTPACIAGHIVARYYPNSESILRNCTPQTVSRYAKEAAQLENIQRDMLFAGWPLNQIPVTKDHAIAAIQSLIDTGEVAWT